MYRALIFDFNGVVVDDEPVHFTMFSKTVAEIGIQLSKDIYYRDYLGFDDHDCFAAILRDQQREVNEATISSLIANKEKYYRDYIDAHLIFVPGVIDFIKMAATPFHLAVVSGALRSEIEYLLAQSGLTELIKVIVAAGEVSPGKPNPAGYLQALRLLNRDFVQSSDPLLERECLVFEDSPWGVQAALAAGMDCYGVLTSYKASDLPGIKKAISHFTEIKLSDLNQ